MVRQVLAGVILILTVWVVSLRCPASRGYHLHIGEPFFSLDQPSYRRSLGEHALPDTTGGSLRLHGIYTEPDASSRRGPLLRFYEEGSGLRYVRLLTVLEAEDGDLIEVLGTVQEAEAARNGSGSPVRQRVLVPQAVRLLRASSRLKHVAQEEYVKIRQTLQESITPQGSRLLLPQAPGWSVVWSKTDGSFIVGFRHADSMYQAEVDCIIRGETEMITHIHAVEWFKGE